MIVLQIYYSFLGYGNGDDAQSPTFIFTLSVGLFSKKVCYD